MSKNVAMFVDVANMYYAARGQDVDVDYVALLKHATKGRDLIRAYAYTGLDPENENQRKFIDFLAKNGYKPVVKDIRKFGDGRMKANLDIELVVDLFRLADRMDIAVIVSGDGDFAPAIRALQDKGVRAEVISFKPNTSSDLIAVADEFTDIMKIASISRKEGRAVREGMSAPEMPAKEVTPEFGFREASPSVAAAALAAIKGGGVGNARRTRSATPRRGAAPSEEPPGERVPVPVVSETIAETGEEARRRRRRRGGRGRGRSRREDEGLVPAAGEPVESAEIAWEEFDDLSQLEGVETLGEEREYTFEEADPATLAELGIDPSAMGAVQPVDEQAVAVDDAAEKPKRGRSRARKTDAPGAPEATPVDEKPKRRTRARKADAAEPAAPDSGDEAEKPKRATRSRKPEAAAAGGGEAPKRSRARSTGQPATADGVAGDADRPGEGADGEPQGIWGRFRSARKPRSGTSA